MKHLLLFLFIFSSPLLLFTQAEYSFLDGNLQWVEEYFYSDDVNGSTRSYVQYNLAGDTIIGGTTYQKVMHEAYYVGGLREIPGQLIMVKDEVEKTVLDFTLAVGDTIFLSGCDQTQPSNCQLMRLEAIDSVEVLDGSLRKRFRFEVYLPNTFNASLYYTVYWIDGIGSTWGLEASGCGVIGGDRSVSPVCEQRLVCVQDNSNLLFNNSEDQVWECSERAIVSSTKDGLLPKGSVTVSPNPTHNLINITVDKQLKLTRLRLQDMTGRILTDRVVAPLPQTHQLSLAALPRGLYVLTTFTEAGEWLAIRVVKR